jgi:hypothetical protein
MSEPSTAGSTGSAQPSEGWSQKKFLFFVALAAGLHLALLFIFATSKEAVPRPVTNVPHLQVAGGDNELLQLSDPTLFALPNAHDFVTAFWRRTPVAAAPRFLLPTHSFLPPSAQKLGGPFRDFMRANPPRVFTLNLKPEPRWMNLPGAAFGSALPKETTAGISGALAQRPLLTPMTNLPDISINDVIAPSKVQVLVNPSGNVWSAVLLPLDSALEEAGRSQWADSNALAIARSLRFAPAPALTFGEIIFRWHTVPAASTNAP